MTSMKSPIRCFTCGKILCDSYIDITQNGNITNNLKKSLLRMCCKRMILTSVEQN